jgi:hypothetical protein
MSPVQKAGLYYPNKFGLITIKSLEEVMGKNGLNAILNLAGLNHYIENYPPDNLDKGFDFAELSAIGLALEEMYGPRGGRGLALRAGRATFSDALKNFGALAGAADLAFVVCYMATGLLQEALKWVSGGNEFRVNESKCVALGDAVCEFIIQKEPIS